MKPTIPAELREAAGKAAHARNALGRDEAFRSRDCRRERHGVAA